MVRALKIVIALAACADVVAGQCNIKAINQCNADANATVNQGKAAPKSKICNATAFFEACFIQNGNNCSTKDIQYYKDQIQRIRTNLTAVFGIECTKGMPSTSSAPLVSGDSGSPSGTNSTSSGSNFKTWQLLTLALCLCCCLCALGGGGAAAFAMMGKGKKPRSAKGRPMDYEQQDFQPRPEPKIEEVRPAPEVVEMPVPAAAPIVAVEEVPVVVETPQGPVVEEVLVEKAVDPMTEPLLFGPPSLLTSMPTPMAEPVTTAMAAPAYSVSMAAGPTAASNYTYQPYGNYASSYAAAPAAASSYYGSAPAATSAYYGAGYTPGSMYTTGGNMYTTGGTTYASPGGVL